MSEVWLPQSGYEAKTYTEGSAPRTLGYYEYAEDKLKIYDAVWENAEIGSQPGDEVILELSKNPLVLRTLSIEQLTLDNLTETIPGAASFSRFEHAWGQLVLARHLSLQGDYTSRQRLIFQLRTFVSDLAHTSYSHLGDWMFQGAGGSEDQHDEELMQLLERGGVNDILRKHNIDPQEVIFPEVEDWVECPSPDLCVDRVDYGVREIRRWMDFSPKIHFATEQGAFLLSKSGKLVMRSHEDALNFAKAFMLLPTEHWAEPVHRLQLYLKEQLVRYILTSDYSALIASDMGPPDDYHPRDYMYTVDNDITREMRMRDPFVNVVRQIMEENIALPKRRIFEWERKEQLAYFFSEFNKEMKFPRPLETYSDYAANTNLPLVPPNVGMVAVKSATEIPDFQQNPNRFDVFLPALKPRSIDPLFYDKQGKLRRLSSYNKTYGRLLEEQKEIMSQAYVGQLHLNPETKKVIMGGIKETDLRWDEALKRPRMDDVKFKRMLGEAAVQAYFGRLVRTEGLNPF